MAAQPPMAYGPVAGKSPGVAVLLSVLVLGGGHLYLNRTGPGIALVAWDIVLIMITLIPFIGWVVGPLMWLFSVAIVAPLAAAAAKEHNRAHFGR